MSLFLYILPFTHDLPYTMFVGEVHACEYTGVRSLSEKRVEETDCQCLCPFMRNRFEARGGRLQLCIA